jgi:hypothetical protein
LAREPGGTVLTGGSDTGRASAGMPACGMLPAAGACWLGRVGRIDVACASGNSLPITCASVLVAVSIAVLCVFTSCKSAIV